MKRAFLSLVVLLTLMPAMASAQPGRIYTCPVPPPREVLEKLDLKLAWTVRVPTRGQADGLSSIQIFPAKKGFEILVQSNSGLVQLMDAETGDLCWRTPVGLSHRSQQPAAANSESIFVNREDLLFVLNRENGLQRIFSVEPKTGIPLLGFTLFKVPNAAPIADEAALFVPSITRLTAYLMPPVSKDQLQLPSVNPITGIPSGSVAQPSLQPKFLWNHLFQTFTFSQSPIMWGDVISVIGDNGTFVIIDKIKNIELFRYQVEGNISAGLGQYGRMAYIGSEDYGVYALDMYTGRIYWRFYADAPIAHTPVATDKDLFVTTNRSGLYRLNRETGQLIWRNRDVGQYLTTNNRFVYAVDHRGFFMVLDYLKGTTLAKLDMTDFVIRVTNTLTDRIYLAAHDGTIICLHNDRSNTPILLQNVPPDEPPPEPEPGKGGAAKKPAEKK